MSGWSLPSLPQRFICPSFKSTTQSASCIQKLFDRMLSIANSVGLDLDPRTQEEFRYVACSVPPMTENPSNRVAAIPAVQSDYAVLIPQNGAFGQDIFPKIVPRLLARSPAPACHAYAPRITHTRWTQHPTSRPIFAFLSSRLTGMRGGAHSRRHTVQSKRRPLWLWEPPAPLRP